MQAIGWRQNPPGEAQQLRNHARMLPVKAIRVVSLAPDLSKSTSTGDDTSSDPAAASDLDNPSASDVLRSQAGLLQLISMLGYEIRAAEGDEDEDVDEEDLGVMVADDDNDDEGGDDSEEEHTPAEV